jgi:hypothetical protein
MLTKSSRTSRSLIALSLALLMSFWMINANLMMTVARAQAQPCAPGQTQITKKSGNGTVCNPDSEVEFFDGTNWVPALVVDPNEQFFTYDTIPGTQWNALNCERTGADNTDFFYRTTFTLPATFSNPSLSIQVHSDNAATIFLNGNDAAHQIGAQPFVEDPANFTNPPEMFTTSDPALFQAGTNTISITVHNFLAGITALDFLADICFTPEQGCDDEEPPVITCGVSQNTLWPPNHELVNVGLTASVTDDCDKGVVIGGGPNGTGVTVYSDEPDLDILGSGNFSPDAKNIGVGTLRLRSERSGNENGRVYLIVVQATDASGKTGFCATTVTVTHDQSKASKDSVAAQAAAAQAYFLTNLIPPPGFVQVGVGPVVGPKQ